MVESFKNEVWKDLPEYEGLYQVSSYGRVMSRSKTRTSRLKQFGNTIPEKILTLMTLPSGYKKLTLVKNQVRKNASVHRLVAQAFLPNPENKEVVNHKDCDKGNNHVENLEWCTQQENTDHAALNNRFNPRKGENHCCAIVTEDMVREIRSGNVNRKDSDLIFKKYGIKYHAAWKIKTKHTWAHVI